LIHRISTFFFLIQFFLLHACRKTKKNDYNNWNKSIVDDDIIFSLKRNKHIHQPLSGVGFEYGDHIQSLLGMALLENRLMFYVDPGFWEKLELILRLDAAPFACKIVPKVTCNVAEKLVNVILLDACSSIDSYHAAGLD